MFKVLLFASVLLIISVGCASLDTPQENSLTLSDSSTSTFEPIPYTDIRKELSYKWGNRSEKVEWMGCVAKKSKATVLLMHADRAGFDHKTFCSSWMAQPFLAQGFDVVGVNRPGYGASTGRPDFTGEQSMVAIPEALKNVTMPYPITGIWGYSTGASAAGLIARKVGGFKFAILGGGLYDYHEVYRLTADDYIRKDLAVILKTAGDKGFEDRSISYELKGFPPKISIYHGKGDKSAPLAQAQAFADSLASHGEYAVSFQVIDGLSHEIPWQHHRKLLEVLAHAQQ